VTPIFVDTSGLYAVIDRDDANHPRAASIWPNLVKQCSLVTNNYVLVETAALLQFRLGTAAVRAFANDLLPLLEVEWVTEEDHAAAWQALLAAARRKLSFVDCVSFHSMRGRGLQKVFCFDAHFREQGFETIP